MWNRQVIFLSLVSLTIGWILLRHGSQLLRKWKKSEATIVGNNYAPNEFALFEPNDPTDDETGTYHAIVEFQTEEGKTITKQLDTGGYPPRPVGNKMTVLYDPGDPLNFVTYPRTNLQIIPRVLVGIGLTGIIVSVADLLGLISIIPD
jgi:Protein of unknown function (DUF3592)